MLNKIYPTFLYNENLHTVEIEPYKQWILENSKDPHFLLPHSTSTHSRNRKLFEYDLFKPLASLFLQHTHEFFKLVASELHLERPESINVEKVNNVKFKLTDMWANVYPKGGYVEEHNHPYANYSGVFLLTCPKDTQTYFIDPLEYHRMTDVFDIIGFPQKNSFDNAKPKDLFIWPSYLKHGAKVNQTDEPKIIISFNVQII